MTRKMQNPEKWIGKAAPHNLEYLHHDVMVCGDCQTFDWGMQMQSFCYPNSQADLDLQKKLGVEEALVYCLDCLETIDAEADRVDPGWRNRHQLQEQE